jgi:hypothetical protein
VGSFGGPADSVSGVDFDDAEYGFKEEDKDLTKVFSYGSVCFTNFIVQ